MTFIGDWRLFAVRISDLSDTPGFPVSIRGLNAHNDRTRYPIAGTMNQRPGLAMVGNIIVSGFGSHCNNFNVTGYLVTASKTPGVGITDIQAMVAAPGMFGILLHSCHSSDWGVIRCYKSPSNRYYVSDQWEIRYLASRIWTCC